MEAPSIHTHSLLVARRVGWGETLTSCGLETTMGSFFHLLFPCPKGHEG